MTLAHHAAALLAAAALASPARASSHDPHTRERDHGALVERQLEARSEQLFGFGRPLARPAGPEDYVAREGAAARERVTLARGLDASYVTRRLAGLGDMIAFWPDDVAYTHLVICIEQGRAAGGVNAAIQRVDVATGAVETILHGTSRCDGIRTTPWGTILATEENGADGRAYEILDPLTTTGHWIADRRTGDVRDGIGSPAPSTKVVQRPRLGSFSWEGLSVLPSGVVYAGDELSPSGGQQGGAIFKFVPAAPRDPAAGNVTSLAQSPLADGTLYALRLGGGNHGQGSERGGGEWLGPVEWDDPADPADRTSRQWARDEDATGFYRPEDLHRDPFFQGEGIRVLWTNTGAAGRAFHGEVLSLEDPAPLSPASTPVVQTFVSGDPRFNSHDNLDVQPATGNVYVIEDDTHGGVWACLRDGEDRDLTSDGCVAALSVVDPQAEPTGFIFDGTGRVAYVVVQHGEQPASLLDFASNPVDGTTDDLLRITGFEVRRR